MSKIVLKLPKFVIVHEVASFFVFIRYYVRSRVYGWFTRFEVFKDVLVDLLYKKRGKYVRPFLHFGTVGLVFFIITVGPVIFSNSDDEGQGAATGVLSSAVYGSGFVTKQSQEVLQFRGGEIITHIVEEGSTISEIAQRYGLQPDTILWENELTSSSKIKPGDELRILPVDGVRHKVQRGETIYTIGKKYKLDQAQVQMIVDYPFNEFLNDETFELATGQYLMVPDGVKTVITAPTTPLRPSGQVAAPIAGVTGTGSFVWPASGRITQGYRFYHKAFDIANGGGGPILAADGGTVVSAGWDSSGYGNKIIIDHGNGFMTLYAHMSALQASAGQRVNRGDVIGQMGSTGRSTGTHLHFEIRQGGVLLDPGAFLR